MAETLRLHGNISFLESDLPLTSEDKALVPGNMIYLGWQYQLNSQWLITMQNYWVGNRKRQTGDTRSDVDNYLKTDLTVLWQSETNLSVRLGIKNLLMLT